MTGHEPYKILVVDDDEAFRLLVVRLLSQRGYEVMGARCVRDANAYLSKHQFVLLIVDYKLPDTDGMTWIEQLRNKGYKTPIAFCSGIWCDQKIFNLLRNILKVSLVLNKPIDPQIFVESIESVLPRRPREIDLNDPAFVMLDKTMLEAEYESILKKYPGSAIAKVEIDKIINSPDTEDQLLEQLKMLRRKLEVEELLNVAKVSYLGELGQIWPVLTKDIRAYKEDPKNKAAYQNAVGLAHKLKGTAGSFHITKVSNAAGKLENMLQSLDPSDDLSSEVIWSEIFRHLSDGETGIREEREGLGSYSVKENIIELVPVLVVGDAKRQARLIDSDELRGSCDVIHSVTFENALATARNTKYGAIVVAPPLSDDPGLLKFTRELRISAENKHVPLLLINTPNQELSSDLLKYAGFSEILPEYISADELVEAIGRVISEQDLLKSRVLVVDDDDVLTSFVSRVLRSHGYAVETLNEPIKIMERLNNFEPHLLILDVIMPGLTGYDVCRMIRGDERWKELTVLFLTSKSNQEGRANAFRAGGDDLLSKPVLTEELLARVNTYIQLAKLKQVQAEIDPATGVYNRNSFLRSAARLYAKHPDKYCLCLFAIDNYDLIAATHGEFACESVLATLSQLLRSRYQSTVVKGRWGEKGFALAFAREEIPTVIEMMELLHDEFSGLQFNGKDGTFFNVTFTTGMTSSPQDGTAFEDLRDKAVQRLFESIHERQMASRSG